MFEKPEDLAAKCQEYFEWIQGEYEEVEQPGVDKDGNLTGLMAKATKVIRHSEPPTITGLALFLGFENRQSLYDYREKEEFSGVIKRAMTLVEQGYEFKLHGDKPTGAIFALKNMGWKDRTETDITSNGEAVNTQPAINIIVSPGGPLDTAKG